MSSKIIQKTLKLSTLTLSSLLLCSTAAFSEEPMKEVAVNEVLDFDKQWDYANPKETEAKFRKLLAAASGSKWDYKAQLMTQIARAQSLQGKFAESHESLDELKEMLNVNTLPIADVRYELERGRCFNSEGKKAEAMQHFTNAYQLSQDANVDTYTVDALHMLGIADEPKEALEWNLKAIALCEKSTDPNVRKWLSSLYNNTGWTYHDMGEFEKALVLFEKNLKLGEQANFSVSQQEVSKWTVARCYRSLKRYDEAMEMQRELEESKLKSGSEDGYVYEEIAELLLVKKNKKQAKSYFEKAYTILSKDTWLMKNEPKRMERILTLSK